MSKEQESLAISLFSEILAADQLVRAELSRVLPRGMEISHFSVLNHLVRQSEERTPAQLAEVFNVTRGAMTNTLGKLVWAGYVHVRPDWDDARRKMIAISPAGRKAYELALSQIAPMFSAIVAELGEDRVRSAIPLLRDLRLELDPKT